MILNILSDSIRYTFSNPKTFAKIILCEIFSFTVLPFLIICGLQYRIIEDSLSGTIFEESKLSQVNNFKNFLKNGVKVFFVKFIYLLIPHILSYFIILGIIPKLIGLIFTGVLFVLLYAYCFIGISNMVYYNSLKKAFAINEISIVKNNIGIFLLLGLILSVSFIFYGVVTFLEDFIIFLGNFINIYYVIFQSFSIYKLMLLFISSITIQPFIDILTARIAGIIYENGSEV